MTKRNLVPTALVILALTLSACGSSSATSATTRTDTATASTSGIAGVQGSLSPVAQNILGIFKLEGTDLAVDSTQAATLLPLWQAYRSLLNNDTTAQAELEALQTQIGEALTDEQQKAIAAMDLTPEDMSALMEESGLTFSAGDGTGANGTRPSFDGVGPGGGMVPPEGGFVPRQGGGQGMGMVTGEVDPQLMATMQASRPAGSQRDRFGLALLDPLIELLKQRAGS